MLDFISMYWLEFLLSATSIALSAKVKSLHNRYKKELAEQKAIKYGLQALLSDRIVSAYYDYTQKGYITVHNLDSIEKMFIGYTDLGGNGMIEKLVVDLKKLVIKK